MKTSSQTCLLVLCSSKFISRLTDTTTQGKFMMRSLLTVSIFLLSFNASSNNLFPKKLIEQHPEQSLIGHSTNFTAEEFFFAYTSKNHQDRKYAQAYLLGVLEATEGNSWCSYKNIKTISLEDYLYSALSKMSEKEKNLRAAFVINMKLSSIFLCKGKNR